MPYMPEWLNESPPPLVFIGKLPPGAVFPFFTRLANSPRFVRPSISIVMPTVSVKES